MVGHSTAYHGGLDAIGRKSHRPAKSKTKILELQNTPIYSDFSAGHMSPMWTKRWWMHSTQPGSIINVDDHALY